MRSSVGDKSRLVLFGKSTGISDEVQRSIFCQFEKAEHFWTTVFFFLPFFMSFSPQPPSTSRFLLISLKELWHWRNICTHNTLACNSLVHSVGAFPVLRKFPEAYNNSGWCKRNWNRSDNESRSWTPGFVPGPECQHSGRTRGKRVSTERLKVYLSVVHVIGRHCAPWINTVHLALFTGRNANTVKKLGITSKCWRLYLANMLIRRSHFWPWSKLAHLALWLVSHASTVEKQSNIIEFCRFRRTCCVRK